MAQKAVFVDTSHCTGCKSCTVACKEWNDLPAEKTKLLKSYQSQKDYTVNTWTYMTFDERYENQKFTWLIRKAQCFHCTDAACLKSCSSGAIYQTEEGQVVIDHDKCIGCGYCVQNCPFGIPKLNKATDKAFKCHGCYDRIEAGLQPACVSICQPQTLKFGDRDEMMSLAQKRLSEVQGNHPRAMVYGEKEMGGTHFIYLLLDTPDVYGLPVNPQMPISVTAWKDVIKPVGTVLMGTALAAVGVAVAVNMANGNYKKDPNEVLAEHARIAEQHNREKDSHGQGKGENM